MLLLFLIIEERKEKMSKKVQPTKQRISKKIKQTINREKLWNEFELDLKNEELNETEKIQISLTTTASNNDEPKETDICEKCKNVLVLSDEGFLLCVNPNCGIIYKNTLDHTPEWRFYGNDDNQTSDPNRVGMPINEFLEESSYGCKVLWCSGSSYEMRKIRRYTEWQSTPYKEKTQYEQFQHIKMLAQNAGIPLIIINDAIRYHKKISEYNQTFRGENKDGLIAASVYISCRINNFPRTPKELATIFNLDASSATRGCKNAQLIINHLEKDTENNEKTVFCKTTPDAFIDRYCSSLDIIPELTMVCKFICMIIEKNALLPENAPDSISSGVIYFVCKVCSLNNITSKDISFHTNKSPVTITKIVKQLYKIDKRLLFPSVIIEKYNIDYSATDN